MNIDIFSPNMLKTFEECEYKFFLRYVEKISLPQRSVIFEKGKKIHALANYFLKGENIEKLEKALTTEEKETWKALKSIKYFSFDVVNTEYNISSKVGKYWIGGRLDALVKEEKDGEKDFYILDYKTGEIPANAQSDYQTMVYLLSADKLLKHNYKTLKFIYIGLKKGVEKEILLSSELKKEHEEKIISTCEKIEFQIKSGVFAKCKNAQSCKHCEFNKLCKIYD